MEFNPNQLNRYINYYTDFVNDIFEKFNQELSPKYKKIIEVITRMEENDIINTLSHSKSDLD